MTGLDQRDEIVVAAGIGDQAAPMTEERLAYCRKMRAAYDVDKEDGWLDRKLTNTMAKVFVELLDEVDRLRGAGRPA